MFHQLVQCHQIRHKGVFIWNRDNRPVLRHRNVTSPPASTRKYLTSESQQKLSAAASNVWAFAGKYGSAVAPRT
jgi:hypothetical protein